jgi:hypothetical protein
LVLNVKGFGRKLQWADLYLPEYFEEGMRKNLENQSVLFKSVSECEF